MGAEYLLINNSSNWEAVETIGKSLPQTDIEAALDLIIESVNSINTGALVVATEKEEVLWVFDFVRQK